MDIEPLYLVFQTVDLGLEFSDLGGSLAFVCVVDDLDDELCQRGCVSVDLVFFVEHCSLLGWLNGAGAEAPALVITER